MNIFSAFFELKFFSLYGLAVFVLAILPNFIFARRAKASRVNDLDNAGPRVAFVEFFSRLLLNIAIVFLRYPLGSEVFLYAGIVILLIYYMLWVRFFAQGSYYPDIYLKRFIGLPIPFDILNSLYFAVASLWLNNLIALVLSLLYGLSRIMNATKAMQDLSSRPSVNED